MVEEGFVRYVQAGLGSLAPGGWMVQLPKDQISAAAPKAWAWRSITDEPTYALNARVGWNEWHVQIDCHGNEASDAIVLAKAIRGVLDNGFRGKFADTDQTVVFGIYRLPTMVDGFSDANRSYVRSLEYVVQYQG